MMPSAATIAVYTGAATTILTYVINTYLSAKGGLPEQIDQAIQTVLTGMVILICDYFARPKT